MSAGIAPSNPGLGSAGVQLSVDFGTSHTVAVLTWADGRTCPLLFDGGPLLPSAVCADPTAGSESGADPAASVGVETLLVGRDAVHLARLDPGAFEATPKRRIDDGTVLLGTREYPVPEVIGAVLARVRQEAVRVAGSPPSQVVLTHPATWGVSRRLLLVEGARLAGLDEPVLLPEPVAAAHHFADLIGERFADGHGVLIYDFGGGTFDASLVIRGQEGFDVRAVDGIDDLGGVDLDELVVRYAGTRLGPEHAEAWQRLMSPTSPEERRHRRMLWDDARMVKERLSRADSTGLHIPLAEIDVTVSRQTFEDLARPLVERTVRTTSAVLRWSQLPAQKLVGVFLVGGSSRVPLVSQLLERALGVRPTVLEQPELVVVSGARIGAFGPVPSVVAAQPGPVPAVVASADPAPPPMATSPPAHQTAHQEAGLVALPAPRAYRGRLVGTPAPPSADRPTVVSPAMAASPTVPISPALPPVAYPVPPARPSRGRLRTWGASLVAVILAGLLILAGHEYRTRRSGQSDASPRRGSASPAQPAYQRTARPNWIPAGWVTSVDASAPDSLWDTRAEEEGGRCEATGDTLRVTRNDGRDLVGCTVLQPLQRIYTDVAVEAEVTVTTGCAALWARTGVIGYQVVVCDHWVRLFRLGRDASEGRTLGQWEIAYRPRQATMGLLVTGSTLTVYLCGQRVAGPITDTGVTAGKVNAGGTPGQEGSIDITLQRIRVFAPETGPGASEEGA